MIREVLRTGYRAILQWLYAKRDYKLFLREGIGSINARTARLTALTDHFAVSVRPILIEAPFGDSALIIAPHQDDEAIGCGGAAALQAAAGRRVHLAMLHDGADGHEQLGLTRTAMRDLRNAESLAAAATIGMSASFLCHADLRQDFEVAVEEVLALLHSHSVDAVFTPWLLDAHVDHESTNQILATALQRYGRPVRVLCYEVWGLCLPNVVVRIDEVIETKRKMLEAFVFANQAIDYTNSTLGLNMYRTRLLGAGTARHIEAFTELPSEDFIALEATLRTRRSSAG